MRVRLLSRGSALAVLQAGLVERALRTRWPSLAVERVARSSAGDRDQRAALWSAAEKGLFTADLSEALLADTADAVVHSWKDLPIAGLEGTTVIATLDRADPRDVLVVRRSVVRARPASITVLSSSPRRGWQIATSAPRLLPWLVTDVRMASVRGNVPTRLATLIRGDGDALIVAKAALDRLLSDDAPAETATAVRRALDQCRWMVLPLRDHPTAPAQGALAVEIASDRPELADVFRAVNHEPTWGAVQREREILASFGGGCHEAVGATVLQRSYGRVTSVRARVGDGSTEVWSLDSADELPPRAPADRIWPRPDERGAARRRALDVPMPAGDSGFWVARAEALPESWTVTDDRLVWAAGTRTWERLAARGIWVHGCADGLGDAEPADVDALAGHTVRWQRLTHTETGDRSAVATYAVETDLPDDLAGRSHFFWTSGSAFSLALARYPELGSAWHASGPGRTARVIRETLGPHAHHGVWLDYEPWHHHVTS